MRHEREGVLCVPRYNGYSRLMVSKSALSPSSQCHTPTWHCIARGPVPKIKRKRKRRTGLLHSFACDPIPTIQESQSSLEMERWCSASDSVLDNIKSHSGKEDEKMKKAESGIFIQDMTACDEKVCEDEVSASLSTAQTTDTLTGSCCGGSASEYVAAVPTTNSDGSSCGGSAITELVETCSDCGGESEQSLEYDEEYEDDFESDSEETYPKSDSESWMTTHTDSEDTATSDGGSLQRALSSSGPLSHTMLVSNCSDDSLDCTSPFSENENSTDVGTSDVKQVATEGHQACAVQSTALILKAPL